MKKCKLFLNVCAALFVVLLVSCSNEDKNLDPSFEGGAVRIKITRSEAPGTKAVQGIGVSPAVMNRATLSYGDGSGHLLFVDGSGIITKSLAILAHGSPDGNGNTDIGFDQIDGTDKPDGHGGLILNVPSESAKVYIFLNLPDNDLGSTTDVGGDISALTPLVTATQLYDASELNGKGVAKVPVSGSGDLVPATGENWDKEAIFNVTAIASRIEITKITGGTSGTGADARKITNFTVKGIYINNYIPQAPLGDGGTYPNLINAGQNPAPYIWTDAATFYWLQADRYGNYLFTLEDGSSSLGDNTTVNQVFSVNAGSGNVWGYNVFPNDALSGLDGKANLPHIVIRLTDIQINGTLLTGNPDKYITVKGYHDGTSSLTCLERGYIYELGTGVDGNDFVITPDDLDDNPETFDIQVFVRATLIPWAKVPVTPEY